MTRRRGRTAAWVVAAVLAVALGVTVGAVVAGDRPSASWVGVQ